MGRRYEAAARVYMLHLVTYTPFEDNPSVYIDARYVWLFSSLDVTSWAYGRIALTILYTTLGVAIIFETR